jgi:hypothetical protein
VSVLVVIIGSNSSKYLYEIMEIISVSYYELILMSKLI